MDLQTVLILILILLTINLIAVGIYVLLVLKEFRETVRKANMVLDDVHEVTDAVANPITTIAGIFSGVTQSVNAVKSISSLLDSSKKKEE
jgi:prophage DNA circulation protein